MGGCDNCMPHNSSQVATGGCQPKCCPSCLALVFVLDRDLPATCPNCTELFRRRLPPKPLSPPVQRDPPRNLSPSLARHHHPAPVRRPSPPARAPATPDPLSDVTRIRVRSRASHCLYPGAKFQGTQKSGRNSYDVTVTIVVRSSPPSPEPAAHLSPGCRLCYFLSLRLSMHPWPHR